MAIGYSVVFKYDVLTQGVQPIVGFLRDEDITLEGLYKVLECSMVERISITEDIDMVCDEEGMLIPNYYTSIKDLSTDETYTIFGAFMFVGVRGADWVPLSDKQLEYIRENIASASFVGAINDFDLEKGE